MGVRKGGGKGEALLYRGNFPPVGSVIRHLLAYEPLDLSRDDFIGLRTRRRRGIKGMGQLASCLSFATSATFCSGDCFPSLNLISKQRKSSWGLVWHHWHSKLLAASKQFTSLSSPSSIATSTSLRPSAHGSSACFSSSLALPLCQPFFCANINTLLLF